MIVNYEWAPLCWNHPLCVYQSELGADQERICKNLSFHTSMKTPHSTCTLSLNVQIQLLIVQENVKLQREFGGRLGKEYIMDTFSHPRLSMKLLLSRFLAVEEIYWGKSFASWIFYQGASQDFFPEFLSHKRGDICPEEKANSPRRAPGMVWTASEVELTPSASLQHKMWSDGFYTL